jgi:hypothetical protein
MDLYGVTAEYDWKGKMKEFCGKTFFTTTENLTPYFEVRNARLTA